MKKITTIAILLGISATFAVQAATAPSPYCPPPIKQRGTISVNTSADKDLSPDVAELTINIETNDSRSMQKATLHNKEISEKVHAELKAMINPANGDYVKTANFSATPVYKYSSNKSSLDKYQVTNNIIVYTKSIDKVGAMIDKSITAGATNVGNLTFSVSKYDSECERLISEASQKGFQQALSALKASSGAMDGISSMYVSCGGNKSRSPQRMYMAEAKMATADAEMAAPEPTYTVIEAGVLKLNANVNAVYFVK